jgi:hypothetical protein
MPFAAPTPVPGCGLQILPPNICHPTLSWIAVGAPNQSLPSRVRKVRAPAVIHVHTSNIFTGVYSGQKSYNHEQIKLLTTLELHHGIFYRSR